MQHPIGMKKDDDNSFFKVPYQTKFAEREAQCILGECRPLSPGQTDTQVVAS